MATTLQRVQILAPSRALTRLRSHTGGISTPIPHPTGKHVTISISHGAAVRLVNMAARDGLDVSWATPGVMIRKPLRSPPVEVSLTDAREEPANEPD